MYTSMYLDRGLRSVAVGSEGPKIGQNDKIIYFPASYVHFYCRQVKSQEIFYSTPWGKYKPMYFISGLRGFCESESPKSW